MTTLSAGRTHTLDQDVIYALPPRRVSVFYRSGTGALNISDDGTNFQAVTLDSNLQAELSALFVKSTTADGELSVKYA